MVRPATTLIVNADDYGYTPGVSEGIRRAAREGIVSASTLMMNTPFIQEGLAAIRSEVPTLPLGVHLVMTAGHPLSPPREVPSLLGRSGKFLSLAELRSDPAVVDQRQLKLEWARQIDRLGSATGSVDHLDSHHHASYLHPALAEVMLELAQAHHLAVRRPPPPPESHPEVMALFDRAEVPVPDVFVGDLFHGSSVATFNRLVDSLAPGVVAEVMVHPAVVDEVLRQISGYAEPRRAELETLTAPGLGTSLLERGFRFGSFTDLWPAYGDDIAVTP